MKSKKGIILLLGILTIIFIIIATFITLIMLTSEDTTKYNRKETNIEYANLLKKHMEEKYLKSFEIVDVDFPKGGFNTGMKQNIVMLKDENGVMCNVKARLATPYKYFDDYLESCVAFDLSKSLDSNLLKTNNFKLYCILKKYDLQNLDISKQKISSLTIVGGIYHSPKKEDIQELYSLYKEIEDKTNVNELYFLVGFVKDSSDFDKAIINYRNYGKPTWQDYNGSFYGYITVKSSGLSYEEFARCLLET